MSLEEIKDQVAKENGWPTWDQLSAYVPNKRESTYWPEVCRRACEETGRLTLEKAAENAEIGIRKGGIPFSTACRPHCDDYGQSSFIGVTKESITDPSNIVIVI